MPKPRKKVCLRVPCYVHFDPDESDGSQKTPARLPGLVAYLASALVLDVDTEEYGNPHGFADALLMWEEAVEVNAVEAEHGGPIPCRHGQRVILTLRDTHGNVVETQELPVNEAADRARKFVLLQGGDPDEKGRGASPGSVAFAPVIR
jgi:hypothetical protein